MSTYRRLQVRRIVPIFAIAVVITISVSAGVMLLDSGDDIEQIQDAEGLSINHRLDFIPRTTVELDSAENGDILATVMGPGAFYRLDPGTATAVGSTNIDTPNGLMLAIYPMEPFFTSQNGWHMYSTRSTSQDEMDGQSRSTLWRWPTHCLQEIPAPESMEIAEGLIRFPTPTPVQFTVDFQVGVVDEITDCEIDEPIELEYRVSTIAPGRETGFYTAEFDGPILEYWDESAGSDQLVGPAEHDSAPSLDTAAGLSDDFDVDNATIVEIVALDNDNVAFVARSGAEMQAFLLSDGELSALNADAGDLVAPGPEIGMDCSGMRMDSVPPDLMCWDPINPAPNGHLLAIGVDGDDNPVIRSLDIDAGETRTLMTFDEEVQASMDEELLGFLSAVPLDDRHLVFLAYGKLWIIRDVFDVAD